MPKCPKCGELVLLNVEKCPYCESPLAKSISGSHDARANVNTQSPYEPTGHSRPHLRDLLREADSERSRPEKILAPAPPGRNKGSMSIADVIEQSRGSIVMVKTEDSLGTGFCVPGGGFLTNAHVVGKATEVEIIQENGNEHQGTVVWNGDPELDIALIEVTSLRLRPLPVGRHAAVRDGEEVVALGHPKGFGFTATRGIVSARARQSNGQTFIQTDASISGGNSGGPLINQRGQAIGVNSWIITSNQEKLGHGLGFAIPLDRALEAMGRTGGRAARTSAVSDLLATISDDDSASDEVPECSECDGSGKAACIACYGGGAGGKCKTCHGTGKQDCWKCGGSGRV